MNFIYKINYRWYILIFHMTSLKALIFRVISLKDSVVQVLIKNVMFRK